MNAAIWVRDTFRRTIAHPGGPDLMITVSAGCNDFIVKFVFRPLKAGFDPFRGRKHLVYGNVCSDYALNIVRVKVSLYQSARDGVMVPALAQ